MKTMAFLTFAKFKNVLTEFDQQGDPNQKF